MATIKSEMRREMKRQERRQVREYKKQLRKHGVPSSDRGRLVREFKEELQKQRRNVLKNVSDETSDMPQSISVSEEYHEYLEAQNRGDETMEETLRRLTGGPAPETVAGILSEETAEDVRERLRTKHETELDGKEELRERFE